VNGDEGLIEDSVCNVTDMQFACLHLDYLLIDYAVGMLENRCIMGENDVCTPYL